MQNVVIMYINCTIPWKIDQILHLFAPRWNISAFHSCNRTKSVTKNAGSFFLTPVLRHFQHGLRSKSQSECYVSISTWFTRSKMGNVLAASPSNPSSSSNVTSIPPPPPLTAPPPVDAKLPLSEKQASNNPGTYEDLHKACKGRLNRSLAVSSHRLRGFFPVM